MRRSRLFETIRESINNETLQQPFNVRLVNESCNQLLERSKSFLSKHRIGNPGGYTPYFRRDSDDNGNEIRGMYFILNEFMDNN